MITRIFEYSFNSCKDPFTKNWKNQGLLSIIASALSFLIMFFLIGQEDTKIELLATLSLFIGMFITQVIHFLWLLFISPFMIIREQDAIISKLTRTTDRSSTINKLIEMRRIGVELRNRGECILDQNSVDLWWAEHLNWRNETKNMMALLDTNKAKQWETLGLFTPLRPFPKALNPRHRKYLQMFDEWLERLQDCIFKLEND